MFLSDRSTPKKVAGIHEIDGLAATNAQLAALTKQVELLVKTQTQGVNVVQTTMMCENCGANHSTSDCMLLASPDEQLAIQLSDRTLGTLPSNIVTNPKEQVQAITTRSGVQLPEIHMKQPEKKDEKLVVEDEVVGKQLAQSQEENPKESVESSKAKAPVHVKAYVPFPFLRDCKSTSLTSNLQNFLKFSENFISTSHSPTH
ncbi:Uncharacterized protein Adt_11652 [Abeliophyllum distichum]|uniref:Uncharacterized protein n=1 Tax=Abeliophyllum distichum TaxID=126358 RepID=A0ABD1UPD2_9LAMI